MSECQFRNYQQNVKKYQLDVLLQRSSKYANQLAPSSQLYLCSSSSQQKSSQCTFQEGQVWDESLSLIFTETTEKITRFRVQKPKAYSSPFPLGISGGESPIVSLGPLEVGTGDVDAGLRSSFNGTQILISECS